VRKPGFTLLECLIGMALSLFVISSGLEFFGLAQKVFSRVKDREEAAHGALAAVDRMRIDLLHAGCGLAAEMGLGLVEAVEATAETLRTASLEKTLTLGGETRPGDTRLPLESTAGVAAGQEIALSDGLAGEVLTVAAVEAGAVVLREPLAAGYSPATGAVSLLERVAYFLDEPAGVLRRRVNASPAQPLLEGVAAAVWRCDPAASLVRVRLELEVEGAHPHESTVFLKNPALVAGH
jgi:type II secretory pathway pseudopilin PulG